MITRPPVGSGGQFLSFPRSKAASGTISNYAVTISNGTLTLTLNANAKTHTEHSRAGKCQPVFLLEATFSTIKQKLVRTRSRKCSICRLFVDTCGL